MRLVSLFINPEVTFEVAKLFFFFFISLIVTLGEKWCNWSRAALFGQWARCFHGPEKGMQRQGACAFSCPLLMAAIAAWFFSRGSRRPPE